MVDLLQTDRVTEAINRYLVGAIDATRLEIELDLYLRPHTVIPNVRQGVYPRAEVVAAVTEQMSAAGLWTYSIFGPDPLAILGEPL